MLSLLDHLMWLGIKDFNKNSTLLFDV